jgi:hypothetical protein
MQKRNPISDVCGAKCCLCIRPYHGRLLRHCPHCRQWYCGQRSCRTFHRHWCVTWEMRLHYKKQP